MLVREETAHPEESAGMLWHTPFEFEFQSEFVCVCILVFECLSVPVCRHVFECVYVMCSWHL